MRDAGKLPATIQRDRQQELDGSPARSSVDDDLVVAPPQGYELAAASRARELPCGREVPEGLGIDL